MPTVTHLLDVDPVAVSLVSKGANRQRFFLMKSDPDGMPLLAEEPTDGYEELAELPFVEGLLKADAEWSAVYCVVAAPGVRENPGMLASADDPDDEWASADEIRKAAHRFMKNGGLVNRMHEDLEPYGQVVENAVALSDFEVDGHVISKGSWYLGIEPTAAGKAAIEAGEFTGVSLQGTGRRVAVEVEKADPKDQGTKGSDREGKGTSQVCPKCKSKVKLGVTKCPNCGATLSGGTGKDTVAKAGTVAHERTIGSKGKGLFGMPGKQLPAYMQHVYNDLVEKGHPTGSATYRLAVGVVQKWARGGDGVKPDTIAKAQAAVAEWEKLKAEARAKPNRGTKGALRKLAAAVGIELDEDLADPVDDFDDLTDLEEQIERVGSLDHEAAGSADNETTEDAEMADDSRIEKLEETVTGLATSVASLTTALAPLAKRLEEDAAPKPEELAEKLGTLEGGIADLKKGLERLGQGSSTQPAATETVAKSDDPLAGILA